MKRSKSYALGYGKPPEHSRFKKGASGNPSGRRKGARPLRNDLEDELAELVKVTENGRARTFTKQKVVIKTLVAKAAKGDNVAIGRLIDLICQAFGVAAPDAATPAPLSQEDQAVIEAYVARRRGGSNGGQD